MDSNGYRIQWTHQPFPSSAAPQQGATATAEHITRMAQTSLSSGSRGHRGTARKVWEGPEGWSMVVLFGCRTIFLNALLVCLSMSYSSKYLTEQTETGSRDAIPEASTNILSLSRFNGLISIVCKNKTNLNRFQEIPLQHTHTYIYYADTPPCCPHPYIDRWFFVLLAFYNTVQRWEIAVCCGIMGLSSMLNQGPTWTWIMATTYA